MTHTSLSTLTDHAVLAETARIVVRDRQTTSELIALLAELDARRLYLGAGCSSLFTYCTQVLHLSEHAAYERITAARLARRFPQVLERLTEGAVTLTAVGLLAQHLTPENAASLLEAARHQGKRDIERLVACLVPQPDIATSVRKVPASRTDARSPAPVLALDAAATASAPATAAERTPTHPRATVAPLSSERYVIRVTVSRETHSKLRRAQNLLRHVIPSGDPAAVVDRALTLLVADLERTRLAQVKRPRASADTTATVATNSRHVPAAVRREVWSRDGGQCAFVGTEGRCAETAFLEFHHAEPFAVGGPTTVDNLALRCRAHNGHEAALFFRELGLTGEAADPG